MGPWRKFREQAGIDRMINAVTIHVQCILSYYYYGGQQNLYNAIDK